MAIDISTVIIEELTGDQRRLELFGAALPTRGSAWGSELVVKTTFPPGSPVATEHVLGPREPPTQMEGTWRTTQLVRSPAVFFDGKQENTITRADILRDAAEDLIRKGQRLRVTWAQGERKITRRGFATSIVFPHDRMDDIHWTVQWQWGDRGEGPRAAIAPKSDNLDQQVQAALKALAAMVAEIEQNEIAAAQAELLGSASTFTLGNLEALASLPSQMFSQLTNLGRQVTSKLKQLADIASTAAEDPAVIATKAVDLSSDTLAQLNQIVDEFSRQVPDAYSTAADRPALVAKLYDYYSNVEELTEDAAAVCSDIRRALLARVSATANVASNGQAPLTPDILAVYIPKTGETFLTISKKFYGTPDNGYAIARANAYPEFAIAPQPGQTIIVPTLKGIQLAQQKF